MPVGAKAVTPAIPDSQNKPGKGSKRHRYRVKLSCFRENPADNIKDCKNRVEYKEENIQKPIPHWIDLKQIWFRYRVIFLLCNNEGLDLASYDRKQIKVKIKKLVSFFIQPVRILNKKKSLTSS